MDSDPAVGDYGSPKKKTRRIESGSETNNAPEIGNDELVYMEQIGGGCYGKVFKGTCRGKVVAIKKFHKQDFNEAVIREFQKEVKICTRLLHPNILLFMGACTELGSLAIVTELMPKGNLETLLHDMNHKLSLRLRLRMAQDCAAGMNWLHSSIPPILHRDLKPSNLLVDEHYRVKVCDFGLSAIKMTDKLKDKDSIPGTPLWMAPEVLLGKEIDEKCDVYSFAIVFWEMITLKEPFPEFQSYREFRRAITRHHVRPPIPENTAVEIRRLMELCWHRDPDKRPSFQNVISLLDDAILKVSIEDKKAREFWTQNFNNREHVSWAAFVPAFGRMLELPPPLNFDHLDWVCAKAVLAEKEKDTNQTIRDYVVSMDCLGQVIDWYGPLLATPPSTMNILDRIRETLRCKWFFGTLDRVDAETILVAKESGTFLVRTSGTVRSSFTISKVSKSGKVNHQRLDYSPGKGFSIALQTNRGKRTIEGNLESLPLFIRKISEPLYLTQPCEGSPYTHIFERKPGEVRQVEGYLQPEYDEDEDIDDSFGF
mmetsp:Transcript_18128/g.51128  ORF Transcript_18128/g.51128 Transcript_18128/m.51128 type:complete len:540 (+) Transcript_18128:203-1822(+)|eukprot:CAMPEP_0119122020 /NCGR_PEP_ID=MMETSP1310-20130426/2402_1 /TAXON_ID=464262 /ORGANISM="Genus nov. species nov., Strain RCC2339" /LENGTH=539 /DNA_ID=CAMNT_0007111623 /DNA_START=197 /DNA_END=1816 /DNA_ORIENTATION=+